MERAKGNDRVNYPRELEECKTQMGISTAITVYGFLRKKIPYIICISLS